MEFIKLPMTKETEPMRYITFMKALKYSEKVITDSGGVQKQAYWLKTPCITLRETTEWIETVQDGWNVLVGINKDRIIEKAKNFKPKGKQRNIFGDGRASKRICNILELAKSIGKLRNIQ